MESNVKGNSEDKLHKKRNNPNIISRLFLWWVLPVVYRGNIRDIEESDLIIPTKKYDSNRLGENYER